MSPSIKTIFSYAFLAGAFLFSMGPVTGAVAQFAAGKLTETRLSAANDPIRVIANQTSPDERHLASVVVRNGKQQVVVDGKPGQLHDGTVALDTQGAIVFNRDGSRVAYTVIQGPDQWFAVIDGKPGTIYNWIARNIVFSPDGRRVAYQAGTKKSAADLAREEGYYDIRLVLDGKEGPLHESISFSSPVFSPDSQHVAYVAKRGDKSVLVIDGQIGPAYDKIGMGRPVFSPDSKHLGYIARDGDSWLVVIDGRPGPKHEYVPENSLTFSPDSHRWAYATRTIEHRPDGTNAEVFSIVVDGKVGPPYDAVDAIAFSPDSRHVAYKARREGFWRMVLDGENGIEYPEIMESWPVFSPDSALLAYWLKTSPKKWTLFISRVGDGGANAKTDTSLACPCRGVSGGQYDAIIADSLVFSPDSKRIAFVAVSGSKKRAVIDGNLGEEFDDIGDLTFSADSSRFAYWAISGEKWRVIADGSPSGPECDGVRGGLVFFGHATDPNGVQLAYGAAMGDTRQLVINGEIVGPAYDKIATGLTPVASGSGFETIAAREKTLYRVIWKAAATPAAAEYPATPSPLPVATAETPAMPANAAAVRGAADIQFESTRYDFGRVVAGEVVTHAFTFANLGPEPVEITAVQPACGCTTTTDWSRRVEPGATGVIALQVDTAHFDGPLSKTAEVDFANHPPVMLEFAGTVWRPVEITPQTAVFNSVEGEVPVAPVKVRIVNKLDQPLLLSPPKSADGAFSAELKTLEPGRQFQLAIKMNAVPQHGDAPVVITIPTSSAELPAIRVQAQAIIQPAVMIAPRQITLAPMPGHRTSSYSVMVRNQGKHPLTLSDAVVNAPGVEVQIREISPGRQFSVTATFPEGFKIPPGADLRVSLKTSDPRFPVVDVPVHEAAPPTS